MAKSNYLLDLNGVQHIDIKGIRFDHCASASLIDYDAETGIADISGAGSNVTIENFEVSNVFRPRCRHSGGIYLKRIDDLVLDQFSVRGIYGAFGLHLTTNRTPISPTDLPDRALIRRGRFEQIGYSAIRIFTRRRCALVHCEIAGNCGIDPHSNKLNFYAACYECIALGCNTLGAWGYGTYQRAEAIDFVNTQFLGNFSTEDGRALWDQNGITGSMIDLFPTAGFDGTSYWLNVRVDGDPQDPANTSVVGAGTSANMPIILDNYILDNATNLTSMVTRGKGVVMGGATAAQEVLETRAAAFENFAAGDIRIKPTSVIRTITGNDRTATIALLKARYPHVPAGDWDLDINGAPINWAAPPLGPATDYSLKATGASFVTLATPASPAIVGQPATWTAGYHQPAWLTPSYTHYRKLPSDPRWTLIPGATGAAYTPVAGDLGYLLAREAYLNGARSFVQTSVPVASGYPLSTPAAAFPAWTSNVAGTQYQTAGFTLQNRPMVVVVLGRMSGTALTTCSVTVGAAGRAAGTGTPIPGAPTTSSANRSNALASVHFIDAPGSGAAQTIQVTAGANITGLSVYAYYIDGAVRIGPVGSSGVTGATLTHTRNVTSANALLIYFADRSGGTSDIAMTAATQLEAAKSGTSATDVAGATAFELAPSAASYDVTATASASASMLVGSVVVESV